MAKQLEILEKKQLFSFWICSKMFGKIVDARQKKKVRKYWQYNLPTLSKTVDEKVLSMGWSSSCHPRLGRLCDWSMCTLSPDVPGNILSCGHGYHTECFVQVDQKCPHCCKYLSDGIKYHCKIFQNTLNMGFDDDDDDGEDLENLENQEDSQEDNADEIISANEDNNKKLMEAIESFRICQQWSLNLIVVNCY